jgi:hypothetical protein
VSHVAARIGDERELADPVDRRRRHQHAAPAGRDRVQRDLEIVDGERHLRPVGRDVQQRSTGLPRADCPTRT